MKRCKLFSRVYCCSGIQPALKTVVNNSHVYTRVNSCRDPEWQVSGGT